MGREGSGAVRHRLVMWLVVLLLAASPARAGDSAVGAMPELGAFLSAAADREDAARYLEREARRAFPDDPRLRARARKGVARNLADKKSLPPVDGKPFTLTCDEVKRTVIDYEIFKLATYLSSGVFPKRYFGYFDERWDTAAHERVLREVTHGAVKLINEAQQKKGSATRVSDIEVAVTFIAEGGALLLREHQAQLDDVHPVYGVGLDDIATGLQVHQELAARFDETFGTGLRQIVLWSPGGQPYLARNMRFKEAILGTALMYVYEKDLAARKLREAEGTKLEELPLDEQFITGSLVYNSGLIFSPRSRGFIKAFTGGGELYRVSIHNAKTRGALPVIEPSAALARARAGEDYPEQPTSWSGMYHVLQRYGGFQGLRRFTTVFDEHGMYRKGAAP